jgi:formylmethanofuran dehydrogenase subunit E
MREQDEAMAAAHPKEIMSSECKGCGEMLRGMRVQESNTSRLCVACRPRPKKKKQRRHSGGAL